MCERTELDDKVDRVFAEAAAKRQKLRRATGVFIVSKVASNGPPAPVPPPTLLTKPLEDPGKASSQHKLQDALQGAYKKARETKHFMAPFGLKLAL